MLVHDQQPAVTPNVAAGIILAARSLAHDLAPELPMPRATQIVDATGATRSRAYEQRRALLELLPMLDRPPGRPPVHREPVDDGVVAQLRAEVLHFIMGHPGCVRVVSKRVRYGERFHHFVLVLRQRYADLTLRSFAEAMCMPVGTIEDWLRPGRVEVPGSGSGRPPTSATTTESLDPPTTVMGPEPSASVDEPEPPASAIEVELPTSTTEPEPFASATELDLPVSTTELDLPMSATEPEPETSIPADQPEPDPGATAAQTQTVLTEWSAWHGNFGDFCEYVRIEHRIPFGRSLIANILFVHGERTPRRRTGRARDDEALRGAFETFFPGAQWVGDGKQLKVLVDGEVFHHNLELVVDAYTDAAVGLDVSDAEDSSAVATAFARGVQTTGTPPLALLLDNKPCNHTEQVDLALGETMRLRSTPGRAQNKAHVEGSFGLFAQTVPSIELCTHDPRLLSHTVAWLVATVFFCVLNRRPRRDRDGLSRIQLYGQDVTPQQRETARAALQQRLRRQQLAQLARTARVDPVVRDLLDRAFDRLALIDPERHVRDAIACYPLDAIVEGIAIFEGKLAAKTLPDGVDARYLLGIVRNVHHCHEAEAITSTLLEERLAARDLMLLPLIRERDAILVRAAGQPTVALDAIVDRLTRSKRVIDRHFWLDAAATLFPERDEQRIPLVRRVARRLHAAFRLPLKQRNALERSLLRRLWPLG